MAELHPKLGQAVHHGSVKAWTRVLVWAAAGVLPTGTISCVAAAGLSQADRTASVVGAFTGIGALGLAVAAEIRARRTPVPVPSVQPPAVQPALPLPPARRDYNGDHIDFSGSAFHGAVTGKREEHHHGSGQYAPPP